MWKHQLDKIVIFSFPILNADDTFECKESITGSISIAILLKDIALLFLLSLLSCSSLIFDSNSFRESEFLYLKSGVT